MRVHFSVSALTAVLLVASSAVSAGEAKVLAFSFEIPDRWHAEGTGGDMFFATGAQQAYAPPWLLAQTCAPADNDVCAGIARLDPSTDAGLAELGCAGIVGQRLTWQDGIAETRWICAPRVVSGDKVTAGASVFTSLRGTLYLAYVAGDADTPVALFLDQVARSMKVVP